MFIEHTFEATIMARVEDLIGKSTDRTWRIKLVVARNDWSKVITVARAHKIDHQDPTQQQANTTPFSSEGEQSQSRGHLQQSNTQP